MDGKVTSKSVSPSGGTFDVAINESEMDALLVSLKNKVDKTVIKTLDDTTHVEKMIKKAWIGEDAEKFFTNFKNCKNSKKKDINEKFNALKTRLNQTKGEWESFRKTNVVDEQY